MITNNTGGTLSSSNGEGIDGYSFSRANGGSSGNRSYSATGGTASSTTLITNFAAIKSKFDGIYGRAKAYAIGWGSNSHTGTFPGGFGTGGSAVAGVVITNNTGGTISSTNGEGIDGYSLANANAYGWTAQGGVGSATATTTITNFAPITSWL